MRRISVLCCVLCAVWTKGETLLMKGFERGEVTFLCSHLFAVKENKYLCRDPCEHTDVLVTVKSGRTAASDRISLKDLGNGSFSVTFSQLQLSDSGRYWCGVDRPGFDTYTEIQLTVMKAFADDTTFTPEPSTTWTSENIFKSTQNEATSMPINLSTVSHWSNGGEQSVSRDTMLCVFAIGPAAIFTALLLAVCYRKRRLKSKPQKQGCSTNRYFISTDENKEVHHVYENFKHSKHEPAAESAPHQIYENLSCTKASRGLRR